MIEARLLPIGERIAEDGVYDLAIERYHTQICDGPSISSSGLRTIFDKSPAHFWLTSSLNPDAEQQPESDALVLGRAAHHLLLGEADFSRHFAVQPSVYEDAKTGEEKPWNNNAIVCRKWQADMAIKGLTVLTSKQLDQIRGMAGLLPWQKGMTNCGLANTPLVMSGALSGAIEQSLIWRHDAKVWLKSRPDAIPAASGDFVDLKTAVSVDDRDLANTVFDHGYHMQGALIGMAAQAVLGIQMQSFTLVFVEKSPPYPVAIKTLTPDDLILGEHQLFAAIRIFERCLETGIWPGPTARQADAQFLNLPEWGRERIKRRLDLVEQELAA
jgi:hypothetical protein